MENRGRGIQSVSELWGLKGPTSLKMGFTFTVTPGVTGVTSFTACEMGPQIENDDTKQAQETSRFD